MAMGMLVVPTWKRLMKRLDAGHEVAQPDADGHRQEDPEGQKAIEKGKPSSASHLFIVLSLLRFDRVLLLECNDPGRPQDERPNLVPHAAIRGKAFFFGRGAGRQAWRVVESRHERSSPCRGTAGNAPGHGRRRSRRNRNPTSAKFADVLRSLAGNIDARLGHDADRVGVQSVGFDPGGIGLDRSRPSSAVAQPSAIWLRQELPVQKEEDLLVLWSHARSTTIRLGVYMGQKNSAAAGTDSSPQPFIVLGEDPLVAKALRETLQQHRMRLATCGRQAVVHPQAVFAGNHQPGPANRRGAGRRWAAERPRWRRGGRRTVRRPAAD